MKSLAGQRISYEEEQRANAVLWAEAEREATRLKKAAEDAERTANQARQGAETLRKTLEKYVGPNQPTKLYQTPRGNVLVHHRWIKDDAYRTTVELVDFT